MVAVASVAEIGANLALMAVAPRSADAPTWWRSRQDSILVALLAVVLSVLVGLAMVKLGTVQRELKAILIMVAGAAMVAAALRPQFGLAMLLALTPFEYHFSGTGTDEVLIVAIALVLMWRIAWNALPTWVAIGGVALALGSFAAAIGAVDQGSALWGAVRWLGVILIMFAAFNVLRERRDASRRMIDIFTVSAVVVVVFALAQKVGVDVLVGAPYLSGQPDSFFGYYTVYAGYVAIAATLATGELLIALGAHHGRRSALYGVALLVILVGVAISTSRGGLLALGGGWLLLLAFNVRRGPVFVRGIVILAVFAGAAYLATPHATVVKFEQRLANSGGATRGEDQTRFALQKAGEQALSGHPFGLGYENFPFYLRAHVRSDQIQKAFDHAHETPVQIGLDGGWLGLFGFLLLWGCPIGLVIARRGGSSSTVRASACAAALGGFMAQGLFDYLFYEIAFLMFFLTLVWGAAHALSVDRERDREGIHDEERAREGGPGRLTSSAPA
jgi:O-Antigen ligase